MAGGGGRLPTYRGRWHFMNTKYLKNPLTYYSAKIQKDEEEAEAAAGGERIEEYKIGREWESDYEISEKFEDDEEGEEGEEDEMEEDEDESESGSDDEDDDDDEEDDDEDDDDDDEEEEEESDVDSEENEKSEEDFDTLLEKVRSIGTQTKKKHFKMRAGILWRRNKCKVM